MTPTQGIKRFIHEEFICEYVEYICYIVQYENELGNILRTL
jgi:hypothetical protein